MFPNTDTADPMLAPTDTGPALGPVVGPSLAGKRHGGSSPLIEAHGGPHTLAVLRAHPEYRRIRALIEEAKFWGGAARRMASLHASHGHYRTWGRARLSHRPARAGLRGISRGGGQVTTPTTGGPKRPRRWWTTQVRYPVMLRQDDRPALEALRADLSKRTGREWTVVDAVRYAIGLASKMDQDA